MNKIFCTLSLCLCFSFWACDPEPVGGNLENTFWKLATIKSGTKLTTLSDSTNISAIFAENEVSGISVCNRYSANYLADATTLEIAELSATERMCDAINTENTFFQLLSNASAFSASENELVIFSEDGRLRFSPMPEKEIKDFRYAEGVGRLIAMFPPSDNQTVPHFYPIVRVDRPGKYPYKGTLVDPGLYKFFDKETSEIWNSTGGDVMAVGKSGDFYVCRVPGRYVSSDIALFRLENGVLKRCETIAWAWCDEGWCNQQDAWLTDINKDGKMDIVQHYTLTDDKGKIREERLSALVQDNKGAFKASEEIKPDKSVFKMAGI